jgi:four helix bundle protein
MAEKNNILKSKSFDFSLKVLDLATKLKEVKQFEIASQVLRSGTSIGANIVEAQRAESRKDFIHKLKLALKEADETKYWFEIINAKIFEIDNELSNLNGELIKLLVSIIKTTKNNS